MTPDKKNLKLLKNAAIFCYVLAVLEAVLFIYLKAPLFSPAGILFLVGFMSTLMFGFGLSSFANRKS